MNLCIHLPFWVMLVLIAIGVGIVFTIPVVARDLWDSHVWYKTGKLPERYA